MSDDGDTTPSLSQNGGAQYNLSRKEAFLASTTTTSMVIESNVETTPSSTMSFESSTNQIEMYGPDQVLPATELYTSIPNGRVKLRIEKGSDSTPISVPGLLSNAVEKYGDKPALNYKADNKWISVTYKEYEQNVRTVAKAFLKLGLERYHAVCIIGFNSPEWFYSDLGAIYAGGFAAGMYTTNLADACHHCLSTSRANIAVVEDGKQLDKILSVKDRLPHLKAIIQYEGKPTVEGVLSWEDVMRIGAAETDDNLNQVLKSMGVNECCTLVFTSGTEGPSKAVMVSHDNLLYNAYLITNFLSLEQCKEVLVSYLPLSHVAAQITDIYCAITVGGQVYFAEKDALKGTLVTTLQVARPTVFLGVPRVWEKINEKLVSIGRKSGSLKKYIADWAKQVGLHHYEEAMRGNEKETYSYKFFRWLIYGRIKQAIGFDRCKCFISAAAPISVEIKKYFMSLDIPLCEAFGMSECSGAHTLSIPTDENVAGVGKTLDGAKTRIDKPDKDGNGELCLYGRHIFMGYLDLLDKTKSSLDEEGWLHSGDIAQIDDKGHVVITGRIKELLITAGGENIPPVLIENNVKAELPIVSNALLIGDKRKFLSILLSLKCEVNPETTEPLDDLTPEVISWLKSQNCDYTKVSEIIANKPKEVMEAIQKGIDKANKKAVSNAQKVQKFAFMPADFSTHTGELGPTLKVKRPVVYEKYQDLIEEFYKNT
ncbi:very long-chain-fatty-acid--CoA ligase bubblegum [Adelges cooleyi]|uniref:very long-chain-fatty-acid--CoA ligase bubblegum n=1 Tax=Adelges cooleyi TaxID=133065 RepID=UPI00217F64A4|nr:very long-chain-fatty-acid--CoA ligase bubblegum [Adelges cooleyi]XP_050431823.1 very long-chain-fatty-acid--CoA ligase bubblegum [Adelges cooleyi]XP_050431824.1 very long-chain-fatty-acid--CoA ligase bubblegum [Adelges cooleyi]XP_050431825.1 very long-chain-fatty-acid--CoA ligase bubblegum [Adelges cooleyi]